MSITISYASRRSEIWRFYRQTWRDTLWKTHLVVFLLATLGAWASLENSNLQPNTRIAYAMLIGISPILAFIAFPILRFKSQERILTVDEEGIETRIGQKNGRFSWSEVVDIKRESGFLVIQKHNLNAFIVPERAFSSDHERMVFETYVRQRIAKAP